MQYLARCTDFRTGSEEGWGGIVVGKGWWRGAQALYSHVLYIHIDYWVCEVIVRNIQIQHNRNGIIKSVKHTG
jgi:hypothetical protein